jgi:hypothetical protein
MICVGMANLTENWKSFLQYLPIKTLPAVRCAHKLMVGTAGRTGFVVGATTDLDAASCFASQLVLMSSDDPLKTEPEDQRMTPYAVAAHARARTHARSFASSFARARARARTHAGIKSQTKDTARV